MFPADDTPPDHPLHPRDQLHHDLKAPLTIIAGRAQLLTRAVRRSPTLTEAERDGMLAGLATIDVAMLQLAVVIDAIGQQDGDG